MADFVADLKRQPGGTIVKYGNGPLDQALMASNLVDEFHLLLTPVAAGSGTHMFEEVSGAPQLTLADVRRFAKRRPGPGVHAQSRGIASALRASLDFRSNRRGVSAPGGRAAGMDTGLRAS